MNTETSKTMTTVAAIVATAVITVAIALASPALALAAKPSVHDPDRCGAYHTLAQCDKSDCGMRCGGSSTNICNARCERRYVRAIKRANRKFNCGMDICDAKFLEVEIDFFDNKMEQCMQKNCEDFGRPQSCYDHCTDTRNNKVDNLCEHARVDRGCSPDVVDAICGNLDYQIIGE